MLTAAGDVEHRPGGWKRRAPPQPRFLADTGNLPATSYFPTRSGFSPALSSQRPSSPFPLFARTTPGTGRPHRGANQPPMCRSPAGAQPRHRGPHPHDGRAEHGGRVNERPPALGAVGQRLRRKLDASKWRDAARPSILPSGIQGAAANSAEEQWPVPPLGCIQATRAVRSGCAGVSMVPVVRMSCRS